MVQKCKLLLIVFLGLGMYVLSGCDTMTDSADSSGLAELEVRIQNSSSMGYGSLKLPFMTKNDDEDGNGQGGRPMSTIEAVYIDVLRVEINNTEDESSGWKAISEYDDGLVINLMEQTNGDFEVLGIAELEEGFYPQIRLVLSDENRIRIEGEENDADMKVPSGQQSGFKINLGLDVEAGQEYIIMLNFDAEQSIVQTGPPHNPGFILKPVLRAEVNGENNDS